MHEYDCLLLEHVFGARPDDAHKVRQFVLDTVASDPGLQQTELVFLGLFGRACRVLEGAEARVIICTYCGRAVACMHLKERRVRPLYRRLGMRRVLGSA